MEASQLWSPGIQYSPYFLKNKVSGVWFARFDAYRVANGVPYTSSPPGLFQKIVASSSGSVCPVVVVSWKNWEKYHGVGRPSQKLGPHGPIIFDMFRP